jgi:serine/threonine-protein kinase
MTVGRQRNTSGLGKVGPYDLLELLGVGGMAEVFKAQASGLTGPGRVVVIKRIQPAYGEDAEFVAMFVAEARILGLLHHPNVVKAYDFGDANGALFLVLEFVDGPSLGRVVRRLSSSRRKMPPAIAAYFAREVCRALEYVHTLETFDGAPLNVIHRDVTPSNIVLTSTGGLKLLDFGVAKYGTSKVRTRHRTLKGKPAYLAPEALEGNPIDARIDLFSLGVVLHEMLTLKDLFSSDNELITIRKVLAMPIKLPSQSHPEVPPALDAVVMKALSRDLEGRYASAREMGHDLNEIVLASRLRVEEVVAFTRRVMREIRAEGQQPLQLVGTMDAHERVTLRDDPNGYQTPGVRGTVKRLRFSRLGRWLFGSPRADL